MELGNENVSVKSANPMKQYVTGGIIFLSILIGYLIWSFVMGDPSNFQGDVPPSDPASHPIEEGLGYYLGLFYKGGYLVGTAIGLLLITLILSIERTITLMQASGRGAMDVFVQKIQMKLEAGDIDGAIDECDRQRGSVGNVVKEALKKYKQQAANTEEPKEKRIAAIQRALEESTALELPMLEKHLTVLATIVSIATLVGLIGTVLGMIKAFSALGAGGGQPDAAALSVGISEALVNTASGITTSTLATVAYNYFTSRIDDMTYRIDEAGISIVETFNEKY